MKKTFLYYSIAFFICIVSANILNILDSKYKITRVGEVVGEITTSMSVGYFQGAFYVDEPSICYHYKFYLYNIPEYIWDNDEALLYPRKFKYPDGSWPTKYFLEELRNGYIIEYNSAYLAFKWVFTIFAGIILIITIVEYIISKKYEN